MARMLQRAIARARARCCNCAYQERFTVHQACGCVVTVQQHLVYDCIVAIPRACTGWHVLERSHESGLQAPLPLQLLGCTRVRTTLRSTSYY